ncbi:D-amino acid dehydrogenase [Halorhodospira halochloris]|uniref:D-amino acid dehydrogenase n=1 Tax=Halorhodospira halochloris TaxID=1052 RepID=UPI001EE949DB|nr:D-amino acid dehydrogenase [Halorhodospira halochloris]MCG5530122.1 D-amino acid dehydrogenase [Halorhodospira halochloris]
MRIVVVGAGVIGATLTWELTERGHQVILVDRAKEVAHETSYANGGQLHAGHAAPWNSPGMLTDALRWLGRADSPLRIRPERLLGAPWWLMRFLANANKARHHSNARANATLALYSVQRLYDIIEHTGVECQLRRSSILKLFDDRASLQRGIAAAQAVKDLGIRYNVLDRAQTIAREPTLSISNDSGKLVGSIEYPEDGCADALMFCQGIAKKAAQKGAELRLGNPVIRLRGDQTQGVAGVVTEHGLIDGDAVVVAAGSHCNQLVQPLGLRLPLEPIKGYSVTIPLGDAAELAPNKPIIDDVRKIVLTRLGDRLRIAGKAEISGFDTRLNPDRCNSVREQGLARFPRLAERLGSIPGEHWSGLRPMTCKGTPLLGPTPIRGLHLATGAGHLGWTFAAGAAELVADQLEGKKSAIYTGPYQV